MTDIINIRTENNKMESRKTEKNNLKRWFFQMIDEIDIPLRRRAKIKREKT